MLSHVVVGINLARISNAQGHAKVAQLGAFAAGHKLLQCLNGHHRLFPAFHLAPSEIVGIGTVIAQQVNEVEVGEVATVVNGAPGAGNGVEIGGNQSRFPGLFEGFA